MACWQGRMGRERLGWRKKRSDRSVTITLHIPTDEAVRGLCAYGSKYLRGKWVILRYERGTQCVTPDSQSLVSSLATDATTDEAINHAMVFALRAASLPRGFCLRYSTLSKKRTF